MKKIILLILFFVFQLNVFAQKKGVTCPLPKHKKGQTSAQINEDTRIYIECKKNQRIKENKERQERENEKKQRLQQVRRENEERQNDEEVQGK